MPSKEFVITVFAEHKDDWCLNSDDVRRRLSDALGYSNYFTVETVRVYDPANEAWLTKIAAIKRVREILNTGLRDSKFLVDSAQNSLDGLCRWAKVTITYDKDTLDVARFQVAVTD